MGIHKKTLQAEAAARAPSNAPAPAPATAPATAPWPIASARPLRTAQVLCSPASSASTPFGSFGSQTSFTAASTSPSPTPPPQLPVTDKHISCLASRYLRGRFTSAKCVRAEKEFAQATRLDLSQINLVNEVSNQRIAKINALLRHFPRLTHLRIALRLNDKEVQNLQLKCLPNLTGLDLSQNLLTEEGVKHLPLDCVPNLLHLDLSHNLIGDDGIEGMQLECVPRLETLSLANNYLTARGLSKLRFESVLLLRSIDLRRNLLRAPDVARLPVDKVPRLQKIMVEHDHCMRRNIDAVLCPTGPAKSLI